MENFQLYRTNLLLGGQMKWDLVVDSANALLYVSDFNLTPISRNIPYIHKTHDNILNYDHIDNVRSFYNDNQGYFYDEGLDSEFKHNYPILSDEDSCITSNIYNMGCRRMKSYNIYGKQLEFFCPVWLEQLKDNEDIEFKISVKGVGSDTALSINSIKLAKNGFKYHDRFVDYFKSYIKEIGLEQGDDRLIDINFESNLSTITGINVNSGIISSWPVYTLTDNMKQIERPLLDTNSMIINTFKDSKTICKQLFNFNICFNIEDILSGSLAKLMKGAKLCVSVDVLINGKEIEKKDFYTEYDHIKRDVVFTVDINTHKDILEKYKEENVLDYLNDNRYIDHISKNKFCQSICHWSLADNNDYIFNVYKGFGGLCVEKDNDDIILHHNYMQYGNTPDTVIRKVDNSKNSTGWINTLNISSWNEFYKYLTLESKQKNALHININTKYLNNIKYSNIPEELIDKKINGLIVTDEINTLFLDNLSHINLSGYKRITETLTVISIEDKFIAFITSNDTELVFANMFEILEKYLNNLSEKTEIDNLLSCVYKLMKNKIDPSLISFENNLFYCVSPSPSNDSTEIEYYKNIINKRVQLFRYDGKIKPTFITGEDKKNTLYYKDKIITDVTSKYNQSKYCTYGNTNYEPLYPSIDFCSIKKTTDWSYNEIPSVKILESNTENIIVNTCSEYDWYNAGNIIILDDELMFNHKSEKLTNDRISDIIKEYLSKYYKLKNNKDIDYVFSLYDIKCKWEYESLTNINDYIYTITCRLK